MTPKRKPASNPVETEAKIRVTTFTAVKRRLGRSRARVVSTRALEVNTLFDSPASHLRASGRSFRVRAYGGSGSVTLKGVARVVDGLKSRTELETQVKDPATLQRILLELGYRPQFRYEKFREVWKIGRTLVCLDETPIGRFVEIEGACPDVHRTAATLGLGAAPILTASYPALWGESGRRGDMLFAPRPGRSSRAVSRVAAATPRTARRLG